MMRKCINRPRAGRRAVAASCRQGCGQASLPAANATPSASGLCLPWREPCEPRRGPALSAAPLPVVPSIHGAGRA